MICNRPIFGALFTTKAGEHYLLDVNTGKFIQLNLEIVNSLQHRVDKDWNHEITVKPQVKPEPYRILKEAFDTEIISDHHPNIKYPLTKEAISFELTNCMEQLIIEVTESCNMSCHYCIFSGIYNGTRTYSPAQMSPQRAKMAIDYLALHSTAARRKAISFYGGEPLLEFQLIRELVQYAIKRMGHCTFSITSNGTLLNPEIWKFLDKYGFSLIISLDGAPEDHDRNRVFSNGDPSYDTVNRHISYGLTHHTAYFRDNVSISCVMTETGQLARMAKYIEGNDWVNLNNSIFTFVAPLDRRTAKANFSDYWFKALETFCNKAQQGVYNDGTASRSDLFFLQLFKRDFHLIHTRSIADRLPNIFHPGGVCIPGGRRLYLRTNGSFYPCERVSIEGNNLKLGNLNAGVDAQKSMRLIEEFTTLSETECRNCWCLRFCNACLVWADAGGKLDQAAKAMSCRNHRQMMHYLITKYLEVMSSNPKAFDFLAKTVFI